MRRGNALAATLAIAASGVAVVALAWLYPIAMGIACMVAVGFVALLIAAV
jgi:hypothetical protein